MRKIYANVDPKKFVHFEMDRNSFVRVDPQSIRQLVQYYCIEDDSYVASFDLGTFFKGATYVLTYTFEKKIRSASDKRAAVSKDRKKIVITKNILTEQKKIAIQRHKVVF